MARSGLATDGSVREGFREALQVEISVPRGSEVLMLFVQLRQRDVVTANDSARKLLHAHVIVAPVIGVEDDFATDGLCQFEAHLRVAHEVAVLLAIVRN